MNKTPKLRFKEFSGEWESKKLGDVAQIVGGGTPSTTESGYWNGNIPWFTPTEIKLQKFVSMSERTITEEGLKKSSAKILPKGTVLLTTRASLGDMAIASQDVTTNQGFQSIIAGNNINNEFIYYLQPKLKRYCYKNASGSTFLEISKNNIEKFKFNMPSLEEQEKIASFFSLIDKKISLQSEKVEMLKEYKNGMMQKIFSRELRFKDDSGRDYPEWKEKKLGQIVNKKKKGKNPIYSEKGNVLLNNEYMENNINITYVENEVDINKEDILILWDGSQAGKMYTGFTGVLGSTFVAITLDRYNCNKFIYQQLKYNLEKIQVAWREGSGIPHVAKDFIENFKIIVPVLEEQRKISDLFEKMDTKLKKEQEKLDSLNEYKKGLLQQMFV
ncbi:MAG: restriction endonuclease subunit S [Romboutsia timonensis]|uniref:restriction endonuclease subunit S n=1 Tax=Romboutsia timonensis TaxID=1776391 RepID=UPI002A7518C4|nr:restriction endonuclease subunit S [Romboutsia timonensis]MDY2882241.1 restriction endonuclease subunit S [Romboutsia timonensis]